MASSDVVKLDENSWLVEDDANTWPRSRYSGSALKPGRMVITIIVSKTAGFGHSHIALEWYDSEVPADRIWQRRHEIYHLLPAYTEEEKRRYRAVQQERAQSSSSGPASGLAWLSNIWDLSTNIRRGEVRMDCRLDYFPIQEGRSYFHSWMVPFEDGWRARREAQESMKHPPDFNLLMLKGNPNCDNYASSIAQAAGIGTSAGLAQRVPIQIPVLTSMGGTLVEDEATMWSRRHRPT